jgi:hypothetical protein
VLRVVPALPGRGRRRARTGRPTCAPPVARHGETSSFLAARALALALPCCGRHRASTGRPTRAPPATRLDRGEMSKLRAARALSLLSPSAAGRGAALPRTGRPTCAPPAASRDRGETSMLSAARALALALPGCRRHRASTGRSPCGAICASRSRPSGTLHAARAPASALPGCGRQRARTGRPRVGRFAPRTGRDPGPRARHGGRLPVTRAWFASALQSRLASPYAPRGTALPLSVWSSARAYASRCSLPNRLARSRRG